MPDSRSVAIVGRPNVGKSSIFNRLVGARRSIVHPESGVTRDRLIKRVTWEGASFDLVDTGGIVAASGQPNMLDIDRGIRNQVEAALNEAAVAVLVVDVANGLHPMDEEVARMVRASGLPALVLANKADNESRHENSVEFERLGFPVFPVSASHGIGFDEAMAEVLKRLPAVELPALETAPIRVAIVGRPNVGKSSYINRILRSDRLIVSDVAGTTRDSVDVPFTIQTGKDRRAYVLVDTAGVRAKVKRGGALEGLSYMRTERSIDEADLVLLVLDAKDGVLGQDKKIAAMIVEKQKACVIVLNKWDLSEQTQRANAPDLERELKFMMYCPVVHVSSKTGFNIRGSVDKMDEVGLALRTTLSTGVLNRALVAACERVSPPSTGTRRLKIFYGTQIGHCPVQIRLFVNDPKLMTDSYNSYLIRVLRESFPLEGLPIVLRPQARRPKRGEPNTSRSREFPEIFDENSDNA